MSIQDGVSFSADRDVVDDVSVVRLRGEIDIAATPTVRALIEAAVEDGGGRFVIDLREVTFLDSMAWAPSSTGATWH